MIHLVSLLMPAVLLLSPASWVHLGFHCPALVTFAIYAFRPDAEWKWALLALAVVTDSLLLGLTDALHRALRYRYLAKVAGKRAASGAGGLTVERLILQNETAIRTLIYHPERPFWPGDSRFQSLREFLAGCLGPRLPRDLRAPRPSQLRLIGRIAGLAATRLARHSAAVRSLAFACVVVVLAGPYPAALATCLALLAMSIWLRFYWSGSPNHRSHFAELHRLQAEVFVGEALSRTTVSSEERAARARLAAVSRIPLRLTLANFACLAGIGLALPPAGVKATEALATALLVLAFLYFCVALPLVGRLRSKALIGLAVSPAGSTARASESQTQFWSIAP